MRFSGLERFELLRVGPVEERCPIRALRMHSLLSTADPRIGPRSEVARVPSASLSHPRVGSTRLFVANLLAHLLRLGYSQPPQTRSGDHLGLGPPLPVQTGSVAMALAQVACCYLLP